MNRGQDEQYLSHKSEVNTKIIREDEGKYVLLA